MAQRATTNEDDKLAKWIIDIARILGHWPFNAKRPKNSQLSLPATSAFDWLRSTVILAIYSACLWFELQLNPAAAVVGPTQSRIILWSVNVYFLSAILSLMIGMWNRNNLLKFLSIIRDFDEGVSSTKLRKSVAAVNNRLN